MSYESDAQPIKLGVLMDFKLPPGYPRERFDDITKSYELVFQQGFEQGVIDRKVEIVYKEVEGFPKGTIKAVLDGYQELVDEGCLVVWGPNITDNAVPTREKIESHFHVPAVSVAGSEEWLGPWTFALPQGSMYAEPIFWADLCASGGHTEVGILIEQSLVGDLYIRNLRKACADVGVRIVAEEWIPQTGADIARAVRVLHEAKAQAIIHCGFGFGVVHVNPALEELDWDPPRFMGTAWQNAYINEALWSAMEGWVGLDQLDEANEVGQAFLDDYEAAYGHRPPDCPVLVNRDMATLLLHAFADAHPLTPKGVRDALERVKLLPAAAGSPGTRVGFGRYQHNGWVGTGYLVARKLTPGYCSGSTLVRRFEG